MPLLKIHNISKSYDSKTPVLRNIDLNIEAGEIFFLLGPSGCGKSTLLRILAGLVKPDTGSITLNGVDITNLPPEKRNTPMVFQNYALWPQMNVYDNVAFGPKLKGKSKKEIYAEVMPLLEIVGMTEYVRRHVTELSGGQQQRVALARALALNSPLILFDEPLSNLDAKLRDHMRVEIRKICRSRNLSAIYVTHDRREALSIGDKIAVMNEGILQQVGSPRDLYLRPESRFTASFLGDVNFIHAKYIGKDTAGFLFDSQIGRLAASGNDWKVQPKQDHEYTLMVRPESIRFDISGSQVNTFSGTVRENTYLGESTARIITINGFDLSANEFCGPERSEGSLTGCMIPPDHIVLLNA